MRLMGTVWARGSKSLKMVWPQLSQTLGSRAVCSSLSVAPSQSSSRLGEELPLPCPDEQALRRQVGERAVELETMTDLLVLKDTRCDELVKQNQVLAMASKDPQTMPDPDRLRRVRIVQ